MKKQISNFSAIDPNTVIIGDDFVYAQEKNTLIAYKLSDGSEQWQCPIVNNYRKSADVFLANA